MLGVQSPNRMPLIPLPPPSPTASADPSPSDHAAPPAQSGTGTGSDGPVPLMSIDVVPPKGNSDVDFVDTSEGSPLEEPVPSQESLFSSSEDPIGDFTDGASPSQSHSLSISSFTSPSGNCSQNILKEVTIVSRGPKGG